jgi:tetratricopeptide (TPR) repeat protein
MSWNAIQDNKPREALRHLDHAIEMSPSYAMAWYMRGLMLLLLGEQEKALENLQKACDLDVRTHRCTSHIQSAMIESVTHSGGVWIDLRPVFYKQFSIAPAKRLFFDHCHPTKYGHQLIAEAVCPRIIDAFQIAF